MKHILLSHVLMAFVKCPPSICAHSEVKRRFKRSSFEGGGFGVAFGFVLLPWALPAEDLLAAAAGRALGGMVVENEAGK